MDHGSKGRAITILAWAGLFISLIGALTAIVSGFGHKWGWWDFRTGFSILRWAAYGALSATGLCALAAIFAWLREAWLGFIAAVLGAIVGITTAVIPWSYLRIVRSLPPIHDITTDIGDPPEFFAIQPLRADAPNSSIYGGAAIAQQQRRAYPDLKPTKLGLPPKEVLAHATQVAESMDWEVVAAVPLEGRLEATAATFWFGFKDDVVVRITPSNGGSRVDVRSVSRVGVSDVGANVRRIRAFLKKLDTRIESKWTR
ncbi:MAG: DUF1499 domain-containing protein [Gammaproteobacteria bacterium]